ncbi:MAG: outer membrane beta-barrel protein [Chitinivibrionales bacterium]|nr:outer membrane beta-barrel protein [Chitinivibrionales bacterium]
MRCPGASRIRPAGMQIRPAHRLARPGRWRTQPVTALLLFLSIAHSAPCAPSFWAGARGGLNLATVSGDIDDEFVAMTPGFALSADLGWKLTRWLTVRTGLGYATRGVRWSYDREGLDGEESYAEDDSRVRYLDVPLTLDLAVPRDWRVVPSVYAGTILSLFLGATKTVEIDGEEVYRDSKNENARNVDLGITLGGAAESRFGPGRVLLDVGYTFGLLTVDGSGDEWVKNRTLSFKLGYALRLNRGEE